MVAPSYNICHGHAEYHLVESENYTPTILPRSMQILLLSSMDMKLALAQKTILI